MGASAAEVSSPFSKGSTCLLCRGCSGCPWQDPREEKSEGPWAAEEGAAAAEASNLFRTGITHAYQVPTGCTFTQQYPRVPVHVWTPQEAAVPARSPADSAALPTRKIIRRKRGLTEHLRENLKVHRCLSPREHSCLPWSKKMCLCILGPHRQHLFHHFPHRKLLGLKGKHFNRTMLVWTCRPSKKAAHGIKSQGPTVLFLFEAIFCVILYE